MNIMRGECKTPGGKLVGVSVVRGGEGFWQCHLDGDFFIDGDDTEVRTVLDRAERVLERFVPDAFAIAAVPPVAGQSGVMGDTLESVGTGDRQACVKHHVEHAIRDVLDGHPNVRILGSDAQAIATAFMRAFTHADAESTRTTACRNGGPEQRPATHAKDDGATGNGNAGEWDAQWHERWLRLAPEVVLDAPRDPQEQMDTDVRWGRDVAEGLRKPTMRFWQWSAPCVVIGRFQSLRDEVHEDVAREEGLQVVRRSTGGGAMFIEPGNTITYSLYAPTDFAAGIDIAHSYRLCDAWLIHALRGLGLDVRFSGLNDIASQYGKIGGAAQRRFPAPRGSADTGGGGAILHHVTLAYDIDAEKMGRVLNVSKEKMRDKAVRSAVKRVDPLKRQTGMGRDELVGYLMRSLLAYTR